MERLSPDLIKASFIYDPATGHIERAYGRKQLGHPTMVKFKGWGIELSHIAWVIYYGEWPPRGLLVDHKDRNRRNNAIGNLRLATHNQNGFNMGNRNAFGYKGVTFDANRTKHWRAQIRIEGRKVNLGRFYTLEEAAEAYRQAALKHHGEFACLE